VIEGLHRDGPSRLPFFGSGWTVDPASPAAKALRQTEQYKDAFREGMDWSRKVAAAEHSGLPPCEPACDIFALNATANGWLVGEKLEAQSEHYAPVAGPSRDSLVAMGRKPVDLETLGPQASAAPKAGPSVEPQARASDDADAEPDDGPASGMAA
jgi:hypothetical protein